MAGGRVRDEDVAEVRQRSRIDSIVAEYVALRSAGGGRLKGLCPFHDEKTPSFHVTPDLGYFNCFGCGEGGDVITFVRKKEQLGFIEAVEWLARRANITLTYVEGGARANSSGSNRARLIGAHELAAKHFQDQLAASPEAGVARQFLADRGFEPQVAKAWGLGYAPNEWDGLLNLLTKEGFTREELTSAGLVKASSRGTLIDSFRGRLIWPIRDISGDVVGFNARKLREDDPGPKYLNSPETPLFKKSSVLYGLDKAKAEIARSHQAVVVEGVADVLACHLAGVGTAVASLGTAFGEEHIRQIRRLLLDQDEFRGEVIFCFDGDSAGQRAAIKAFAEDQRFVTQTFVAVEPGGLDPCELRLKHGDTAVRDLVARRVPLFEFVIKSRLEGYDLESSEGRVQALNATAPIVASIKDRALRPEYVRRLAGWLGMEVEAVSARIAEAPTRPAPKQGRAPEQPGQPPMFAQPTPDNPTAMVEREVLKAAIQRPVLAGPAFDALDESLFTFGFHPPVRACVRTAGGTASALAVAGGTVWIEALREAALDDEVRALVTELAVDPMHSGGEPDEHYVEAQISRLQEIGATRRIQELKSRLQRLNPVEATEEYNKLFGELIALEQWKRSLREKSIDRLPPPSEPVTA